MKRLYPALALLLLISTHIQAQIIKKELPEKVAILTFDDAISSHATYVAPLLKEYGFGGTFFICEFPPDFETDKANFMTWKQIKKLHKSGFEVANHTKTHAHVNRISADSLTKELEVIEGHCAEKRIPHPISFAYPGYDTHPRAVEVLYNKGYQFARVGGSYTYNPEKDHPYYIPSFSTSGNDSARVFKALQQAKQNEIVVLTLHGVPDLVHPWVNTPPELFEAYLAYLKANNFTVWGLKELKKYINFEEAYQTLSAKERFSRKRGTK